MRSSSELLLRDRGSIPADTDGQDVLARRGDCRCSPVDFLSLGLGIDEKVAVYVQPGDEQEVLTLFTPDVMERIVDANFKGEIHLDPRGKLVFTYPGGLPWLEKDWWAIELPGLLNGVAGYLVDKSQRRTDLTRPADKQTPKYREHIKRSALHDYWPIIVGGGGFVLALIAQGIYEVMKGS